MELTTSTNIYFERENEPFIPMRESIIKCSEAGYKQLDFGFAELILVSERFKSEDWLSEIKEYKELAKKLNIKFIQAHATIFDFCNLDSSENYKFQEELFKRSIEGAAFLGAEWIVVHPSTGIKNGSYDNKTHENNVMFFKEYSEFAKSKNINLAIENMWGKTKEGIKRYAVEPSELLKLVQDVNKENVKVCWDVEHGSIEGLNQKEAILLLKDYIVTTHISDESGIDNIHILPYLGKANWNEILEGLGLINYNGIFNFEIQHYLPRVPKELIPQAIKFSYEVGNHMIKQLEMIKRECNS